MSLLGNGFRHNLTGRITTATTALDGCNASVIPASFNLTAFRRNQLVGSGIANAQASVPQGVRPPIAWLMAREGGGISSYRRTDVTVDGNATGELGYPADGTATIVIDGSAVGGLIVGATGTATIAIDGTAAIVATLNSTGQTTITIDGAAAMGAIASLTGTATLTIDGSAEIMGLGYMTGSTLQTEELTPASIATAVWNALLANHQGDGSAGKALSTASTGGVDLNALAAAVLAAAEATPIHADLRKILGDPFGGDGTEANPWGPL